MIKSGGLECLGRASMISENRNVSNLGTCSIYDFVVQDRRIMYLLRISQAHIRLYLPQTIRNPKDAINQCPISRPLDFEVSEQSVRPEKCYGLV